jgi:hypothetical protein
MRLLEEVAQTVGDTADVVPVTDDVVLVVSHEQPTVVSRCTRDGNGAFQLGLILAREELEDNETTALSEHLVRHGIVWDPEVTAAADREFLENDSQ